MIDVLGARGNGVKIRFALSAVMPSKIVNNGSVGVGVREFDDEYVTVPRPSVRFALCLLRKPPMSKVNDTIGARSAAVAGVPGRAFPIGGVDKSSSR